MPFEVPGPGWRGLVPLDPCPGYLRSSLPGWCRPGVGGAGGCVAACLAGRGAGVRGIGWRAAEIKRVKGIWWMPWRMEAMKDVARCEKLWGGASNR